MASVGVLPVLPVVAPPPPPPPNEPPPYEPPPVSEEPPVSPSELPPCPPGVGTGNGGNGAGGGVGTEGSLPPGTDGLGSSEVPSYHGVPTPLVVPLCDNSGPFASIASTTNDDTALKSPAILAIWFSVA